MYLLDVHIDLEKVARKASVRHLLSHRCVLSTVKVLGIASWRATSCLSSASAAPGSTTSLQLTRPGPCEPWPARQRPGERPGLSLPPAMPGSLSSSALAWSDLSGDGTKPERMTPHEGRSLRALPVWSCPTAYGKERVPAGWPSLIDPASQPPGATPWRGTSTLGCPCQIFPRALQIHTPRPRQDSPPWCRALRSLGTVQGDNRRSYMEVTTLTLPLGKAALPTRRGLGKRKTG